MKCVIAQIKNINSLLKKSMKLFVLLAIVMNFLYSGISFRQVLTKPLLNNEIKTYGANLLFSKFNDSSNHQKNHNDQQHDRDTDLSVCDDEDEDFFKSEFVLVNNIILNINYFSIINIIIDDPDLQLEYPPPELS